MKQASRKSLLFTRFRWMMTIMVVFFMFFSITAQAAIPYTYTFAPGAGGSTRKIQVSFDYPITILDGKKIVFESMNLNSVVPPTIKCEKPPKTTNILEITISQLDPTLDEEYLLLIPVGALSFDGYTQLEDFRIRFNSYQLNPGFKTLFVDSNTSFINEIFKRNTPAQIQVKVPKKYIKGVTTNYLASGWTNTTPAQGNSLASVDIEVDESVERIDIDVKTTKQPTSIYQRRLLRDGGFTNPNSENPNVFHVGFAGIDVPADPASAQAESIEIKAYSAKGELLETRIFKLKSESTSNYQEEIGDPNADIFDPDKSANFNLQQLLEERNNAGDPFNYIESIIRNIPVSQLDMISIYFPNISDLSTVTTLNQLASALADPNISRIKVDNQINAASANVELLRLVDIDFDGVHIQNMTINTNASGTMNLLNAKIDGNLTINAPNATIYINENTIVTGTTLVQNVAYDSLHTKGVHSGGITLTGPGRLHLDTNTAETTVTVNTTAPVILAGKMREVISSVKDTNIELAPGTEFNTFTSPEAMTFIANDLTHLKWSLLGDSEAVRSINVVKLGANTYVLDEVLEISVANHPNSVTLRGSGKNQTILKAGEISNFFNVTDGKLVLEDLTIDGDGKEMDYALLNTGNLTLKNVVIKNIKGSGILTTGGTLDVRSCEFTGIENTAIEILDKDLADDVDVKAVIGGSIGQKNIIKDAKYGVVAWNGTFINDRKIDKAATTSSTSHPSGIGNLITSNNTISSTIRGSINVHLRSFIVSENQEEYTTLYPAHTSTLNNVRLVEGTDKKISLTGGNNPLEYKTSPTGGWSTYTTDPISNPQVAGDGNFYVWIRLKETETAPAGLIRELVIRPTP